jgi:hypothetical protein
MLLENANRSSEIWFVFVNYFSKLVCSNYLFVSGIITKITYRNSIYLNAGLWPSVRIFRCNRNLSRMLLFWMSTFRASSIDLCLQSLQSVVILKLTYQVHSHTHTHTNIYCCCWRHIPPPKNSVNSTNTTKMSSYVASTRVKHIYMKTKTFNTQCLNSKATIQAWNMTRKHENSFITVTCTEI